MFGLENWKDMRCQVSIGNVKERQPFFEMDVYEGRGQSKFSLTVEQLYKTGASKIFFSLGNDCYGIADLCEIPELTMSENIAADTLESAKKYVSEKKIKDATEDVDTEDVEEDEILNDCLEPQPDKWEVIKKKYPILYPFKGQGPYVSIKPVDLQLLDSQYHHLSNNSFLMHNFYQYKHLILGEYEWEKGTFFYVGVPGEFIKKEQNIAAMFGFEGYEHSGDLGYYLYRVAL